MPFNTHFYSAIAGDDIKVPAYQDGDLNILPFGGVTAAVR